MLARKFRLPSKDILPCLKKGRRQNLKYFNISFLPSNHPQIAVIVSNKIDNRAAHRNKIKRRLKETIQKNLDKFQNKKITFFAKKEILNAKFSEILAEINRINFL